MLYFCTENERNLFSIENRPVGFYTECLLKANIMQEKDEKSFFDLYSGSKEIDVLEKFGIGPVILKKVLCIVSLH